MKMKMTKIELWRDWLLRASITICLLAPLALIIKVWLIEPYSTIEIEFRACDIEIDKDGYSTKYSCPDKPIVDRTLKGDREI